MKDPTTDGDSVSTEAPHMGLAREVEQLMKLPQHLCKQRGICCKVATFKGSLGFEEIQALAAQTGEEAGENAIEVEMAQDFVSIFQPYESQDEVRTLAPAFVERVRDKAREKGQDPDAVSFFHCKFVLPDGRCGVHEDRPVGCRTYPFPHKNTIYHPGCGYEQKGQENWLRIQAILDMLGIPDGAI